VTVRFKAVGRAPILRENEQRGKIGSDQKFGTLSNHLRKLLKIKTTESMVSPASPEDGLTGEFLYVNSNFAPGLDETVGNLFQVPNLISELDWGD
jgi:ubiquitin-like protein ATG12